MGTMRTWLALAVFVCSTPVSAKHIVGEGQVSCGAWVQVGPSDTMKQWVFGYLSAMNAHGKMPTDEDILTGLDAGALTQWISNFCRANPLSTIEGATLRLIIELGNRADPRLLRKQ